MAKYEVALNAALLSSLLSGGKKRVAALLESVLNQVLEAHIEGQFDAAGMNGAQRRRVTATATGCARTRAAWGRSCWH